MTMVAAGWTSRIQRLIMWAGLSELPFMIGSERVTSREACNPINLHLSHTSSRSSSLSRNDLHSFSKLGDMIT